MTCTIINIRSTQKRKFVGELSIAQIYVYLGEDLMPNVHLGYVGLWYGRALKPQPQILYL